MNKQNTSNSVHLNSWGIGKHLKMVYIVETTKTDKEVEEIYFSNIHQFEHDNINSAMQHMIIMQRNGWNNIHLSVHVYNKEQLIIEDIAYDTEFTSTSEIETMKENKKMREQVEHTRAEISNYKEFMKRYKAEKTFEQYTEEQKTINKDSNNLYWYEMLYRPLSPFCQPKNHVEYDETKGKHGIVAYNRPLTESELSEYELRVWNISA